MAEPYNMYHALTDRGSVSRSNFPGYLSSELRQLASQSVTVSTEVTGASSDFRQRDINPMRPGSYGLDGYSGVGVHPDPLIGGIMPGVSGKGHSSPLEDPGLFSQIGDVSGRGIGGAMPGAGGNMYPSPVEDTSLLSQRRDASICVTGGAMPMTSGKAYPSPLEDPNLLSQRGGASVHVASSVPDVVSNRPGLLRSADGPARKGESNILFVDGLPTDCTRREVGLEDLFRPFVGYKEIKVIHKEARNSGDRATVLCFVEFIDAKCALTAMEALQGYKFDDKKPESPSLKIQFAHFPFRHPSDRS